MKQMGKIARDCSCLVIGFGVGKCATMRRNVDATVHSRSVLLLLLLMRLIKDNSTGNQPYFKLLFHTQNLRCAISHFNSNVVDRSVSVENGSDESAVYCVQSFCNLKPPFKTGSILESKGHMLLLSFPP